MTADELGTISISPAGRVVLTLDRGLPHPVDAVWHALTQTAHLRAWFADLLDYERSQLPFTGRPGSALSFVPNSSFPEVTTARGQLTRSEAPRILEYSWGSELLRWQLTEAGSAATRLTFTNVTSDRDFAAQNALGWHTALNRLDDHLAGGDPARTRLDIDEDAAAEVLRGYERLVA